MLYVGNQCEQTCACGAACPPAGHAKWAGSPTSDSHDHMLDRMKTITINPVIRTSNKRQDSGRMLRGIDFQLMLRIFPIAAQHRIVESKSFAVEDDPWRLCGHQYRHSDHPALCGKWPPSGPREDCLLAPLPLRPQHQCVTQASSPDAARVCGGGLTTQPLNYRVTPLGEPTLVPFY